MRLPRLFLAVVFLPLAVCVKWEAPAEGRSHRPPTPAVQGPAAPSPHVVPRSAWGADAEAVRERPSYVAEVRAVFIHHTNHTNSYECGDVPAMLRALQRDHIRRKGWDDLGYNFVVDRCGTIYQGRGGDTDRTVRGAHTRGFNTQSVGIAALGSFEEGKDVPRAVLEAIAAVAAWKLEPGIAPHDTVRLVSTHSASRYPKGTAAVLPAVAAHRHAFATQCPGDALTERLPWLRDNIAERRDG